MERNKLIFKETDDGVLVEGSIVDKPADAMLFAQKVIIGTLDALYDHILRNTAAKAGIDKEGAAMLCASMVTRDAFNLFAESHDKAFDASREVQKKFDEYRAERRSK